MVADMLGILIFDQLNDLIYSKGDQNFRRHIQGMAVAHGLSSPTDIDVVSLLTEVLVSYF